MPRCHQQKPIAEKFRLEFDAWNQPELFEVEFDAAEDAALAKKHKKAMFSGCERTAHNATIDL